MGQYILFFCSLVLPSLAALQLQLQAQNPYCDEWSLCLSGFQCFNKRCVPLTCNVDRQCFPDFVCRRKSCVSLVQSYFNGRYCDQWTPCAHQFQCVQKKCAPFNCKYREDCADNFKCQNGQCIYTINTSWYGQYCDEWTKCLGSKICLNNHCIPYQCERHQQCLYNYRCQEGFCKKKY